MSGFGKYFAAAIALAAFGATPASAQATRTFVSGVGSDSNPCSRTAPCRTFQGAIGNTAPGGEVDCLDPGGYGAVTIVQSVTIYCPFSDGGVLVAGQNAIIVNDSGANNIHVVLDGLNVEGLGNSMTSPGIRGIWFFSGASLTVRNTTIRGFQDPTNGTGIAFTPGGAAHMSLENVILVSNGVAGSGPNNPGVGGGILVQPTGSGGSARVMIKNVRVDNGFNNAFRVDTTGATNAAGVNVTIDDSTFSGHGNGVVANAPAGTTSINVLLRNSDVSNNSGIGVLASGAAARIRVSNTGITGNGTGVAFGGGAIVNTYGNNNLNGNTVADGLFTAPPIDPQ